MAPSVEKCNHLVAMSRSPAGACASRQVVGKFFPGKEAAMMINRLMALTVFAVANLLGCASMNAGAPAGRSLGWQVPLGNGTATSYGEFDDRGAPTAIGVALSA